MSKENKNISVVVPVFNEEENISVLCNKLNTVLSSMHKSFEIILVDDGSKDKTFEVLVQLRQQLPELKIISLSRNFGHQIALTAGLEHAAGEVVISLDGDMQHPPELIPELYAQYEAGFDIVNTIRIETKDAGMFKNVTSKTFYKIINRLSNTEIIEGAADFRLMSRKALDAFLQLKEKDRFTRGLVSWMGFKQTFVSFEAASRFAGKSKYTVRKMVRFALDGVTSFSSRPLRLSFVLGLLIAFFGLCYAVFALIMHFSGQTIQGWTSLLIVVLLMGGVQLISIGIIGEYLSRVYNEVKNRPLYFVKDTRGFENNETGQ